MSSLHRTDESSLVIDDSSSSRNSYIISDFKPPVEDGYSALFGSSEQISTDFDIGQSPSFQSTENSYGKSDRLSRLTAPFPTAAWWVNLYYNDLAINAHPYVLRPSASGLGVNYPTKSYTYHQTFTDRIQFINISSSSVVSLNASELLQSRVIDSYDQLTVTMEWPHATGKLRSCFSQGMGFATLQYDNLTPSIDTTGSITSINGMSPGAPMTNTKFKLILSNGQTWVLYASSEITLSTHATNPLLASGVFTGSIQLGYISTASDEDVLDRVQGSYVTGGSVRLSTEANVGYVEFDYSKNGSSPLLTHILPHHLETIRGKELANISYNGLKGDTVGIIGDSWVLEEPLSTIAFAPPNALNPDMVIDITEALTSEIGATFNVTTATSSPYYGGKYLAKWARYAQIADELDETALAASARAKFKNSLIAWLEGTNSNALRYDITWGGIIPTAGSTSDSADFGSGVYNDHHFHHGYMLYAAAILGKTDSAFVDQYKQKINELAAEIASPNRTQYFSAFRHKDWYNGHSWAHGIKPINSSRSHESSSEAINAYYGLTLWGAVSGNSEVVALGQIMTATEIHSTRKYYHPIPTGAIYHEDFNKNYSIGIMFDLAVHYNTFFSSEEDRIHGIQMLPIVPMAQLYLEDAWVTEEFPILYDRVSETVPDTWLSLIVAAQAVYDQAGALTIIEALSGYDDGQSLANLLHWVATR